MADRQYVTVKYREEDKRAYTFHFDGDPLSVGDRVSLGSGFGVVAEVGVPKPSRFDTKPILGLAPKPEAED